MTTDPLSGSRPAYPLGAVVLAGLMNFWTVAVCVLHLALLIIVVNNRDALFSEPGAITIYPSGRATAMLFVRWSAPLALAVILAGSAFVLARRRRSYPLWWIAAASVCLAVATTAPFL